jgi:hypothetical protein
MNNITASQANATHTLFHLLRKLGVIGLVTTKVRQSPITESGRPTRYHMRMESYDPNMKGRLTKEEQLVLFFSYVEELGYDDDSNSEPLGSCRPRD